MAKKVLFVCGGRFRSVVAEYLLREILREKADQITEEIDTASAGIWRDCDTDMHGVSEDKVWGRGPYAYSIASMQGRGIDISGKRSIKLTRQMVEEADLVIVFEKDYKMQVLALCPSAQGKVFTLQEFVGRHGYFAYANPDDFKPILDTISHDWAYSDECLEQCIIEINDCLSKGIDNFISFLMKKE